MKIIYLNNGKEVFVDDSDYEYLNQWKWTSNGHSVTRFIYEGRVRKILLMHRLILNAPHGTYIDHMDLNGFNNQRSNLRLCTPSQNAANTKKRKTNKSGYKGVCWYKNTNKWMAYIQFNNRRITLGYFKNKKHAIRAYRISAKKYFGEFARF